MSENVILSKRDAGRIQKMLRWFERTGQHLKPQHRRRTGAVSGGAGVIRIAYVKDDAVNTDQVTCYLDTDTTGTEITVTVLMSGETRADRVWPPLLDGVPISVHQVGGVWTSVMTFSGIEEHTVV